MNNIESKGLANNLAWKFLERISAQIVSMLVSIILARLLEPSHYGQVAMVTIFITIANVFVSDGFGSALIQKHDADEIDFYSVLYFNLFFSLVLYLLLFITAPLISNFYGDEYTVMTPVLRVLGIRIILTAINSVQQAYIAKKMIFKKFFFATLTGTLVSAFVGVLMAYSGFGVWALVFQYLTNTTVDTVFLFFSIGKKPKLLFSFDRIKLLIPFGTKILGVNLLIKAFEEFKALLIGKIYSSQDLGFYDKGKQFPSIIINNISATLSSVLFPKMANDQKDKRMVKTTMKLSIRNSSFLLFPMMIGLFVVAEPFVKLVLTEKWLPCVPLLRAFCVAYMFMPIHSANMQAIKALGKGKLFLIIELVKKAIELFALLICISLGVQAVAVGIAICNTVFVFINALPNKKLLNYGVVEQLIDIMPGLILSSVMGIIVFGISFLPLSEIIILLLQIVIGISVYILMSIIFKNKEFFNLMSFISQHSIKNRTS